MLTKKDRQQLIQDMKEVFATKDDLKSLSKQEDLQAVKNDVVLVKNDVVSIKTKLDDLYSFSLLAFGNLFDWVEDIHKTIVKKDLPKRVKKLEKYLRSS